MCYKNDKGQGRAGKMLVQGTGSDAGVVRSGRGRLGTSSSITSAQFAPAASGVKRGVIGADMERCRVRAVGRPLLFRIILRDGVWF